MDKLNMLYSYEWSKSARVGDRVRVIAPEPVNKGDSPMYGKFGTILEVEELDGYGTTAALVRFDGGVELWSRTQELGKSNAA